MVAALRLDQGKPPLPAHAADLAAIANVRDFYKLSRLRGQDLATPWGCQVRYRPWFGTISYIQSCADQLPDRWCPSSQSCLPDRIDCPGLTPQ